MTAIVTADKCRLTLRGVEHGRSYLVTRYPEGWWVQESPRPLPPRRKRQWRGPKRDLAKHLDALAEHGLTLDAIKQEVPPCRF